MFNTIPRWLQRWTLEKVKRPDPKLEFILSKLSLSTALDKGDNDSNDDANRNSNEDNSEPCHNNGAKAQSDIDDLILIHQLSLGTKGAGVEGDCLLNGSLNKSLYGPDRGTIGSSSVDDITRGRTRERTHNSVIEARSY